MHNKMTTLAGAIALAFASSASAQAQTQTTTPTITSPTAPPITQDAQPAPAAPAPAASDAAPAATGKAPVAAAELGRVDIIDRRQRLDAARNSLSPETGSTVYRFEQQDIKNLPLGDATPLNQIALQAPGVVQDSFGQIFVRGDHGNVQYRINGVVIPEAISGFGQALDTRFADRITLITGALPAQYGYRTAGVIDINTKGADLENGGNVELVAGSRGHREGSASIGGTSGALSYFFSGSYLENDIGIENPTPESSALHDKTRQAKGFGYLSYLLGNDSRISFFAASTDNRFQIPDRPGLTPSFMLANTVPPASETLDARQRERNKFQVLSFQSSLGAGLDYQVSLSHRDTDVHYRPDRVGDLVYNGVAAEILRSNEAYGLQADASKKLDDRHTLRFGLFAQRERGKVDNSSLVFPADANGNQISTTPETIVDDNRLGGHLYGVYLQDEWKPTPALTVNYGARYDRVDTVVKESQLSPRLGATWQLGENTRLHAGYARYFTPPASEKIDLTSVQKFQGTTNALPSDANTAVKSERTNYYDAGISHQLTRELTLGADAYYRDVRHLQDEGQFGNALIFSNFNYERGRIYGLELSASYRHQNFSAYGNLALSSAKGRNIETGQFNFGSDELAYIAGHWVHLDHDQVVAASMGAAYRFADGTALSSDLIYGSGLRRGFVNSEHLPSYTQVNAAVARSFDLGAGFGRLDARFSVINVFDRIYELRDGTGIGVSAPQFGPRRGFYVTLSKPFSF